MAGMSILLALALNLESPGFQALRAPVQGFELIQNSSGLVRLIETDHPEPILTEGDERTCQAELLRRLEKRFGGGRLNWEVPTAGGLQFWSDVRVEGGWRIQKHVFSGHHRLIDQDNVRRAWGSRGSCDLGMERSRLNGELPNEISVPSEVHIGTGREVESDIDSNPSECVLLLHGLGRTRRSMLQLAEWLEADGYQALPIAYASTRGSATQHALNLESVLSSLRPGTRVHFVTHSFGAIVLRATLAPQRMQSAPWTGRLELGRAVLIAAPNQGSVFARGLTERVPALGSVVPALRELSQPAQLPPPPPLEFALVAGQRKQLGKLENTAFGLPWDGWNPWLAGEDDGLVRVAETHLPGCSESWAWRGIHSLPMQDQQLAGRIARFLRHGSSASPMDPVGPR